jgi:transcription elongation factor GreA
MTQEAKKKLEEEIQKIEYELHNELPKELKRAIALGDLTENAEYHMAKQRQEILRARLEQLSKRLHDLAMVDVSRIPRDRVALGTTVVVYDLQKDAEVEYRLVTTEESDVSKGMISTTSPIGRGLLGKRVGDTVKIQTPAGLKELEILRFTTIHDQQEGLSD